MIAPKLIKRVLATEVEQGQYIAMADGPRLVLGGNPERQSAGSGSGSVWEITVAGDGKPTHRWLGNPDDLVDVVEAPAEKETATW